MGKVQGRFIFVDWPKVASAVFEAGLVDKNMIMSTAKISGYRQGTLKTEHIDLSQGGGCDSFLMGQDTKAKPAKNPIESSVISRFPYGFSSGFIVSVSADATKLIFTPLSQGLFGAAVGDKEISYRAEVSKSEIDGMYWRDKEFVINFATAPKEHIVLDKKYAQKGKAALDEIKRIFGF